MLKYINNSKIINVMTILFLFFLLCIFNLTLSDYYLRIINLIGINIILVASLNLTNGFTGIFSLGHAGFMAVGAYTSALITMPIVQKLSLLPDLPKWLGNIYLPFPLAIIISGLAASVFAVIIGIPVLRLKGHYLAVATLGFLVVIRVFITNADNITRGARGIMGIKGYTNIWWVYSILVITIYLLKKILNSAYGRSMIAIREDSIAAQSIGINVTRIRLMSFCIGAFFAGIGGALWGHLIRVISPGSFSYNQTFLLVEMSVIGGSGSLSGAVIGASIMTILPELLRNIEGGISILGFTLPPLYGISQLILSVLLIVVIIFRPEGIMGFKEINIKNLNVVYQKLKINIKKGRQIK